MILATYFSVCRKHFQLFILKAATFFVSNRCRSDSKVESKRNGADTGNGQFRCDSSVPAQVELCILRLELETALLLLTTFERLRLCNRLRWKLRIWMRMFNEPNEANSQEPTLNSHNSKNSGREKNNLIYVDLPSTNINSLFIVFYY